MARTEVAYTDWVANSNLTDSASAGSALGTTIDSTLVTNGVSIPNAKPELTVLRVTNTAGSALDVTVQSGNRWMAAQGDLVEEVAATTGVEWLGPFGSARFLQSDGAMHVDFESGFTGKITVFKLPRAT